MTDVTQDRTSSASGAREYAFVDSDDIAEHFGDSEEYFEE
jgi:hypothetical protein